MLKKNLNTFKRSTPMLECWKRQISRKVFTEKTSWIYGAKNSFHVQDSLSIDLWIWGYTIIWCLSSKCLPIQPSMSDLQALDWFYDLQNQILFHSYKNTKILSSEISGEECFFLLFRQLEKKRPKFAFESYQLCFFTLEIKTVSKIS